MGDQNEMKNGKWLTEKHEIFWEKMNRVGKRGGHTTPVASFRRTIQLSGTKKVGNSTDYSLNVSSRKLAACLWEMQHRHYNLQLDNMRHGGHKPDLRPSPITPDTVFAASRMQHHSIRSAWLASYGSSIEIPPNNPAATPSSSTGLKGIASDEAYSLETSTQLLKALNRVWSLEDQHISNISLIKSLKKELNRAHSQIKQMVRDQQNYQHELMMQDHPAKAAIQSMRDELEEEKKVRMHSESLHRKLPMELYEVKKSLAAISKELEKEKKSCDLLVGLCDHFINFNGSQMAMSPTFIRTSLELTPLNNSTNNESNCFELEKC